MTPLYQLLLVLTLINTGSCYRATEQKTQLNVDRPTVAESKLQTSISALRGQQEHDVPTNVAATSATASEAEEGTKEKSAPSSTSTEVQLDPAGLLQPTESAVVTAEPTPVPVSPRTDIDEREEDENENDGTTTESDSSSTTTTEEEEGNVSSLPPQPRAVDSAIPEAIVPRGGGSDEKFAAQVAACAQAVRAARSAVTPSGERPMFLYPETLRAEASKNPSLALLLGGTTIREHIVPEGEKRADRQEAAAVELIRVPMPSEMGFDVAGQCAMSLVLDSPTFTATGDTVALVRSIVELLVDPALRPALLKLFPHLGLNITEYARQAGVTLGAVYAEWLPSLTLIATGPCDKSTNVLLVVVRALRSLEDPRVWEKAGRAALEEFRRLAAARDRATQSDVKYVVVFVQRRVLSSVCYSTKTS